MKTFKTISPYVQPLNPVEYHGTLDMDQRRCDALYRMRDKDNKDVTFRCRRTKGHSEGHDWALNIGQT